MATFSASNRILKMIVPTLALLLSVSAWAADAAPQTTHASLELQDPMTVAGTQLQSGKCSRVLTQLYFSKQKCALRLDNESSTSAAQRAAK